MSNVGDAFALQNLPSGADPIDRLHRLPEAAARLQRLRDAREQAFDLSRAASGRMDDAKKEWRRAESAFAELERIYREGRVNKTTVVKLDSDPLRFESPTREIRESVRVEPDAARIERERSRVARLKSSFDRRVAEYDRHGEAGQIFAGLLTAVEAWIKAVPRSATIAIFEGPAKKAQKGPLPDAVEALRGELLAIWEEISDVRSAPKPSAEIKAALAAYVDRLAAEGQPGLELFVDDLQTINLPKTRVSLHTFLVGGSAGVAAGDVPDATKLLIWLCRDLMVERLEALVDGLAEDDVALSAAERTERLAALETRKLEVERREADLLHLADEAGTPIMPRRDMNPAAFLGVEVTTGAAA